MKSMIYGAALAAVMGISAAKAESPLFAYPLERPGSFCVKLAPKHQCAKTAWLDIRGANAFRFVVQGTTGLLPPIGLVLRYDARNGTSGYLGERYIPVTIQQWIPSPGGGNPPLYASPIINIPPSSPKANLQLYLMWDIDNALPSGYSEALTVHFAARPLVQFYR